MKPRFAAAPWSTSLKFVSAFSTLLLLGAGIAAYQAVPTPAGFAHAFSLGIAGLFPLMLVVSVLFMVSGYTLNGPDLFIVRPLWSTRISLSGLQRVFAEPKVCKGSIRLFGNSGLFAFTGLYRNSTLGRYRLFATDFAHAVVLVMPDRTVVITPASPHSFIAAVRRAFPQAITEQHSTQPSVR